MCNLAAVEFARRVVTPEMVTGKRVLEVGSLTMDLDAGKAVLDAEALADPMGSVRGVVSALRPAAYVGLDLEPGPGVDVVGGVEDLVDRFGQMSFDLVIATELMEHIADWRTALRQIHAVGRLVLITTRSDGFPFHRAPWDYWRYEPSDATRIWPGALVEPDPISPGIFVLATELGDIDDLALRSILTGRRQLDVGPWDSVRFRVNHPRLLVSWLAPRFIKDRLRRFADAPRW